MTPEALRDWFTDRDTDASRRAAWKARQAVEELRERGLARIMSSDAHSVTKLGEDHGRRTLTKLRLDDANFEAVRNAVLFNPKARCRAEAVLPATYPRLVRAHFEGGFLDGVMLEFSPNLNCIIGGRGSGKSTALIAIAAALGQPTDEDPDDPDRMPDVTTVTLVDRSGSVRTAVRRRTETPVEPPANTPIALPLADMGQDESGRLARDYNAEPRTLLDFLDSFVPLTDLQAREQQCLSDLVDNGSELLRTNVDYEEVRRLGAENRRLEGNLKAAQSGQVEEIARWAGILASQTPLLQQLEAAIAEVTSIADAVGPIDLDRLASEFGADLMKKPAVTYVTGDDGLRSRLDDLHLKRVEILNEAGVNLEKAAIAARHVLASWKAEHEDLLRRLDKTQRKLAEQGLKVQAGAVRELMTQLHTTKLRLSELREASDELRVNVYFQHLAMDKIWCDWLSANFPFRSPRVQRLAAAISPGDFADKLMEEALDDLLSLKDDDGQPFFTRQMLTDALPKIRTWEKLFELHTMRREDRPRIEVREPGSAERKQFDHLSAGQQRSILLSIILTAAQDDPLVLDQPEDHLDARYVATAVVRHLEAAKERRQVVLATHSANLTVLGDAELVTPLRVEAGHGRVHDPGAIDRPATREQVCSLLEGGIDAYRRRGERYGFRFDRSPDPVTS